MDEAEIKGQYYRDVAAHMKKITGASRVLPVVHIARRLRWEDVAAAERDLADDEPVTAPTANQSELVRDSKLEDLPAAEDSDLVAVYVALSEKLRNAKTGYNFAAKSRSEAWEVKANPGSHKWYYAANMTPDEALLIKQFDSKKEGVARRTPHIAFSAKEDFGPTRQSVEVRCLCFWEYQPQN